MAFSPPENLFGDRKKAIQVLIQGRQLANQLTNHLGKPLGDDKLAAANCLLMKILGSFTETISILNPRPIEELSKQNPANTGRKSEDSEGSSRSTSVFKDRRGCYKRRKTTQTWTRITPNLIDDGHAWRKYGQKVILNSNHPRNYYRCTHKFDQGCQATKQVQRTEDDPPMYRTTYHGNHTCQNPLRTPQIILDSTILKDNSNSILLSFGSSKLTEPDYPTFPTVVKQEYTTVEQPQLGKPSSNHKQSMPVADHYFSFADLTAFDSAGTMPVLSSGGSDHGDVISSSGVYSCTASTHDDSHSFDLDMIGVGDFEDLPFEF